MTAIWGDRPAAAELNVLSYKLVIMVGGTYLKVKNKPIHKCVEQLYSQLPRLGSN